MACCYKVHDSDTRTWGSYEVLEAAELYVVKRIVVSIGQKLSLQTHEHRNEHWIVTQGLAEVTIDKKKIQCGTNDTVFIPAKEFHRIENIGNVPLIFIEVQTGSVLDEADIQRYNEDYTPRIG